mgnify:CR=1 FL=1
MRYNLQLVRGIDTFEAALNARKVRAAGATRTLHEGKP